LLLLLVYFIKRPKCGRFLREFLATTRLLLLPWTQWRQ